jgi:hypothetical protein
VAQLNSASDYGSEGYRFESCRGHHKNREGKVVATQTSGNAFVKAVISRADIPSWNEKLLSFNIKIDGPLAHAWVGYEFWLGDTFSHCGVNSIHLMKKDNAWKIINITDSRRRADCH